MLNMSCPNCGKHLEIPEQFAGKRGTCTYCKHPIIAPAAVHGMTPLQDDHRPPESQHVVPPQPAKGSTVLTAMKWGFGVGCGCLVLILVIFFGFSFLVSLSMDQAKESNGKRIGPSVDGPPDGSKATLEEFMRLEPGMSYELVVAIIGSEGSLLSSVTTPGIPGYSNESKMDMYTWEGDGTLGANMNATFTDSILQSKAQFGLK